MIERHFVKVADTSEIPEGKMKKVNVDGTNVLVINVGGKYYAVKDSCPILGGDFSEGTLDGEIISCQQHRAKFNVTNGTFASHIRYPSLHPKVPDADIYEVEVDNGAVLIGPRIMNKSSA